MILLKNAIKNCILKLTVQVSVINFLLSERSITTGFQHLQLNKSSKYRRNAVFFCQIPPSFTLYMLYNYGDLSLYLIWR